MFIVYLGFYVAFNTVNGHITTGSWKGRGNQYIQFVRVLYCKLPTNGKQLPAFPLEAIPGTEPRPQRWEARVLPLCHCGPSNIYLNIYEYNAIIPSLLQMCTVDTRAISVSFILARKSVFGSLVSGLVKSAVKLVIFLIVTSSHTGPRNDSEEYIKNNSFKMMY